MSEWQDISTAPRNGMSIMVSDPDCGQFIMHWNATAENGLFPDRLGFWESLDLSFTWSEHDGMGPTRWKHLKE